MRAAHVLPMFVALLLAPVSAQAMGMPELPPDHLPTLELPDAIPDDLERLPTLPDVTGLFPELPTPGEGQGEAPEFAVPLGPPSPLPPEDLPPGLKLGPPGGFPTSSPHFTPVPEPGTAVLTALGLGLLASRRRR